MKFLIDILRPNLLWFIGLLIVTFCIALSASLKPYALRELLDFLSSHSEPNNVLSLAKISAFYLAVSLFPVVIFRIHNFIWVHLLPNLKKNIAASAMLNIQFQPYGFFQVQPAASVANKIKESINAIPDLIKIVFDDFFCGFLTLAIAVVTVWSVHYKFGIGLLLWVIIYCLGSIAILKHAKKIGVEGIQQRSRLLAKIVEILENIKCIRLLNKEKVEEEKLGHILDKCQLLDQDKESCTVKTFAFQGFSFVTYQSLCLYWLLTDYKSAEITLGDFALVLSINHFFVDYFRKISKTFVDFSDFFGNILEGTQVLTPPIQKNKTNGEISKIERGEIIFQNVCFQYEGYPPLFRNQSVHIKDKEKVAIVGRSGSGKSTFIDLILRFYDVQSGQIIIDGKNITNLSTHSLRSGFSVVPQAPALFYGTLMDNIRYGKEDATQEEVIEAAKVAEIHEFILNLPDGYNSWIDSLGRKLSAGQRQRIAIARAILKNSPIFILDEAMSHLDALTESRIQQTLTKLAEEKTMIIITHRPSSVLLNVDKILVFDRGEIIERGNHYELSAKGGYYHKLWEDVGKFAHTLPLDSPVMTPASLPL